VFTLLPLSCRDTGRWNLLRGGFPEVVQLYVREADARPPAAIRELRGFERVPLKAGERKRVRFTLVPERDLAHYDEVRKTLAVAPGEVEIEVGASSRDLRLRGRVRLE
jgi:beta-glucosidase